MNYLDDKRIVLTLDAGGTNFVFSAIQSNKEIVDPVILPAQTKVLEKSLETIESGFRIVMKQLPEKPVAISFAFPGPADYPNGIIDNVGNLPAFAGGVPLGPWLEKQFGIPVFINNDGDLFVYGEAIAGLLPKVNKLLEDAGSPKRYQTLFGITLGTGFGAGLVHKNQLFIGDNSNATEIWLMRNKVRPNCLAEDGASIRAVRNSYARNAGIDPADVPEPKEIAEIARDEASGDKSAAIEAFRELGEVVGDALANASTLFDGLVVIGGGLSRADGLFMPAVLGELNGQIANYDGGSFDRIVQKAYNLEDANQAVDFIQGEVTQITIPGTDEVVAYDPLKRIAIGTSVLGTSAAVGIGAYAYALNQLDA
ncbi:ROK family protein [Pontiella sulfatireligans]|uniref:N-acetyl-D-glucosamine kinase n=1 Tax=Pontiella sulfatireligans TaxID=2750658 RepID=A0A6C2UJR4_9BACT|nr:ROK family protein [Pontiella sulfatireligans]VGO19554.1 N-acetyl-D-glucosamine kinase [Pontiella sulfatireligans]